MKITKLGHCCLLIEEKGLRILTDPGAFSTLQNDLENINIILITHEHTDHFHIGSVKTILQKNPSVKIITNKGVAKLLDAEKIAYTLLEHAQSTTVSEVLIEGFGDIHAEIYKTLPRVPNTGYMIANRFYYPGDVFFIPSKPVEILALPVAGSWMKISEAIDFALAVKPKVFFAVHDAILNQSVTGFIPKIVEAVLNPAGMTLQALEIGKPHDFN